LESWRRFFTSLSPFLVATEVPNDRSLRILVQERTGLGPEETSFGFAGREIVRVAGDAVYEIMWDLVVCFAVRGDPFPADGPSNAAIAEVPSGSAFVAWVKSECRAEPDYVAAMNPQGGHSSARVAALARELQRGLVRRRLSRAPCGAAAFRVNGLEPSRSAFRSSLPRHSRESGNPASRSSLLPGR
jgi:hypothetical protein